MSARWVVVGAGLAAAATAWALGRGGLGPGIIIEQEPTCGGHASGAPCTSDGRRVVRHEQQAAVLARCGCPDPRWRRSGGVLGRFSSSFLHYLEWLRFTGDVHGVPEGTPVFPPEAILEIAAPLPEAQLVETLVMNQVGLQTVGIFASGSLNEDAIARLLAAGAPIDAFGVGTEMGVSGDAPALDIAYKLVEYAGHGRLKLSPGKALLPGRKQIFRVESEGAAGHDILARHDEGSSGRPLLQQVMKAGTRLPAGRVSLDDARALAAHELARLPSRLRGLEPAEPPYRVVISPALAADRDVLQQRYAG